LRGTEGAEPSVELESAVDIMSFSTSGAAKESNIAVVAETAVVEPRWRGRAQLFSAPSFVIPRIKVVFTSFVLNLGARVEIMELEMATTGSSRYMNGYLRSAANVGSYLDHAFDCVLHPSIQ
jgi:hypothetical protein